MIGIYKITCLPNGIVYVGQSLDIDKRIKIHKSTLNKNRHNNKHLQRAWNKYGKRRKTNGFVWRYL